MKKVSAATAEVHRLCSAEVYLDMWAPEVFLNLIATDMFVIATKLWLRLQNCE